MKSLPARRRYRLLGIVGLVMLWSPYLSAGGMAWNLNDVSFLFRLPDGSADANIDLLRPQDRGNGGELLPEAVYRRIPTLLNAGKGNATLYRGALRVTSVRVDPCPDPASCNPELRLVWQPIEYDKFERKWTARDAALHCVYPIPEPEFSHLKQDLWDIKTKYRRLGIDTELAALEVHPALQNQSTADSFNRDIQSVILKYAGSDSLRRITFTALRVPTKWWRFGGFEQDEQGEWGFADIPRVDAPTLDIFNVAVDEGGLGPNEGIDAIFNVLPEEYPESDNIFAVINKGYRTNDHRDLAVFREKIDAIARFRNPHRSTIRDLDCASCHYADAARYYAANRFPELRSLQSDDAFKNPDPAVYNLRNTTVVATSTRVVRAFGYFDDKPAVSQRTIHDSVVSAHWLNHGGQTTSLSPTPQKAEDS